jgi:hypothetical protein
MLIRITTMWLCSKRGNEFCYCDIVWNIICFCVAEYSFFAVRMGGTGRGGWGWKEDRRKPRNSAEIEISGRERKAIYRDISLHYGRSVV